MNQERIEMIKKFIEDEPENPFNRYALAMEYFDSLPERALELLRQLIASHPDYLPTYYKIAHLLWDEESWDEAENAFEVGLQLAAKQNDEKAARELRSAYQNFEFERE